MENNFWMEILVVLAVLCGPFIGIAAQSNIDLRKQAKERKLDVFKTLMATRATPLSREHVSALNRIDTEFSGTKDKKVREAWNTLLDHFGNAPNPPPIPSIPSAQATSAESEIYEQENQWYQSAFARWNERIVDLRTSLLKEMGAVLDYDFDEVHIKKAAYNPKLYLDMEMVQQSLIQASNEVFTGKRPLPMFIVNWPEQQGDGDG